MKKIMLFLFTFVSVTMGFAQQQVATLNHNDTISAFYGASALQQALDAAVKGDIITLSSGTFNAVNITKTVTIRGAGMFADTATGTLPTIIRGGEIPRMVRDSKHHLSIEGVYFSDALYIGCNDIVYDVQCVKCRFNTCRGCYADNCSNAEFINCIFHAAYDITYSRFTNCVILYDAYNHQINYSTFFNCFLSTATVYHYSNTYYNSIIYTTNNTAKDLSSFKSYNCIGISSSGNSFFVSPVLNNCHNLNSLTSVFKTYNGSYNEGETFYLQDSIVSKYLGTDYKQIGIYGGIMPFDSKVGNPRILRSNVGLRSTADGKLSVDIEVVP